VAKYPVLSSIHLAIDEVASLVGARDRFIVLDVDGEVVVINTGTLSGNFEGLFSKTQEIWTPWGGKTDPSHPPQYPDCGTRYPFTETCPTTTSNTPQPGSLKAIVMDCVSRC